MSTSCAAKAPYWNSVARIGPASTISPTAHGVPSSSTQRSAQSRVRENASGSVSAWRWLRLGRITVASAMPNTPSGNSTRRSE
jgi:hypothetical protein